MPNDDALALVPENVWAAYDRIKPLIHQTPLFASRTLSALVSSPSSTTTTFSDNTPTTLVFKAESLQRGGAFKIRGAMHAVARLSEEERKRGVCTHSSGNHAQALAIAARESGAKCWVVMPDTSPVPKREATAAYGATITFCPPLEREETLARVQEETGAVYVPPYDDPRIILGQGTIFVEFVGQEEELDAIIVPVGGGGMLAGCALAASDPELYGRVGGKKVRVFGAEPYEVNDCAQGLACGTRVPSQPNGLKTVCDGLRTPVGKTNFPIIQKHAEKVFTVTEEEVKRAMRLVWERLKLVVEPSGCVGLAVVLSEAWREYGVNGKVGIVFSGGNVDLSEVLAFNK
ncbi:hypothetical protein G7K_5052-t1 [Saitoella complicata NRRL Y-17804]|uniref:Serine racemase n=2 Tax=Saitoella complicata (strain BCRC 22490 / CBS 7301 / JCM 7358 / NBRC 10748 / NRRL Y-17804) TaxID=698492 RepID=A0A0E9NMB8_SAICN|nr:hypothetical protein G7K_5052-t1 [Saitoella complicata NRRL Y-17804]